MTPADHNRVRQLYFDALDLESDAERQAFLTRECGSDSSLLSQLRVMLKLEREAGEFFRPFEERAAGKGEEPTLGAEPPQEEVGATIGRYKLLEMIGEGGFGVVYMAEQVEPVRRRVALKIIKLGMDTREVIARFSAERQALALMDHPNVARVLDAGATAAGRPYFVMELVRGLPITEYCDRNRLNTRERIELFIKVCHAAQHAHSKGIIHRDLKPSNILVGGQDGHPLPKVIDFGIAKAMQAPLTDRTLFTRFGQMVGTPVYMSPEHLDGVDIDTRSDVYSLGVILYELLTGRQPFDLASLKREGQLEIIRVIREEDPPRPSTRLTTLGDELEQVASRRNVNPRHLGELLRGDLDWITMKALRKNRVERYSTPQALAEDLQRHLENRAVHAGPPRFGYRAWKFAQRHRYAVGAAAGIMFSILAALVFTTFAFLKAREERERAVVAERLAEKQRVVAVFEADRSRARELRARQISYASDMALASHALEVNNLGRVLSLLQRHAQDTGPNDLRGWEWRYLWQQCQSLELFQLGELPTSVISIAASADGALVAATDLEGTLSAWDIPARKRLFLQSNSAPALAVSPDGHFIVGGDMRVRDSHTGAILRQLAAGKPGKKLAFSRDGRWLAVLTDLSLALYETTAWERTVEKSGLSCMGTHVRGLAMPATADWVAVGDDTGMIRQFSVPGLRLLREWKAHPERVTALAAAPDGKLIASATGYSDGRVRLWAAETGGAAGVLEGHRAWVSSLAFSTDGSCLVSGSADQIIRVWDVARQASLMELAGHFAEVWSLTGLSEAKAFFAGGKDGAVKAWRVSTVPRVGGGTPSPGAILPGEREPWFLGSGQELAAIDGEGWVRRWSVPGLRELGRIEGLGSNQLALCSSASLNLLAAVDKDWKLRIWDEGRQTVAGTLDLKAYGDLAWMGFAARAARLLVVVQPGALIEFEAETGAFRRRLELPDLKPNMFCVSPDARFLVCGGRFPAVYSLETGQIAARLPAHKFSTDAVTFSPDGQWLATSSTEGNAKIWQSGTWEHRGTLSGHLLGVHCIAFSPDGLRLATGSLGAEAVKVWDLRTMQEVLNLSAPGDFIYWLGFSPAGDTLAAMGSSMGLRLWSAPHLERIPPSYP